MTPDGVVTTLAGLAGHPGNANGFGAAARFSSPKGIAVDSNGNVYVGDSGNNTVRRVSPSGVVSALTYGGWSQTVTPRTMCGAMGVAVDAADNVFIAASCDNIVYKIPASGKTMTAIYLMCPSARPQDVEIGPDGSVFIANGNFTIERFNPVTGYRTVAGRCGEWGWINGTGADARFSDPSGIAVGADGRIYVADRQRNAVRVISPAGDVQELTGSYLGAQDGGPHGNGFNAPMGMTMAPDGHLYLADSQNHTIRKITTGGWVSTVIGRAPEDGRSDGVGSAATFRFPSGIRFDLTGHLVVADTGNSAIRRISPAGAVTTLATAVPGASDIVSDSAGYYWVTAHDNTIRKVTAFGTSATVAGTAWASGSADGQGSAARFSLPRGITFTPDGSAYVADTANGLIRKIAPNAAVSTIAGVAKVTGHQDGTGAGALFSYLRFITTTPDGNLVLGDGPVVRRVSGSGVVTTIAGQPASSSRVDGPVASATFRSISGVAYDHLGNLVVADSLPDYDWLERHAAIRLISPVGVVSTIAGGARMGSEDGTGPDAKFSAAQGVALSADGSIFVADSDNNAIRVGRPAGNVRTRSTRIEAALGELVQLDVNAPGTAYLWDMVRRPAGSVATLSSSSIANPTFVPDRADLFVFRLRAVDPTGVRYSTVSVAVACPAVAVSVAVTGATTFCVGGTGGTVTAHAAQTGLTYQWAVRNPASGIPVDIAGATGPALQLTPTLTGGASGTRYVVVKVANECGQSAVSAEVAVTVAEPPQASISVTPAFLTWRTGDNVASVPSAGEGAQYEWTVIGGTITAGQGTPAVTFATSDAMHVAISVSVTSAAGCIATSTRTASVARPAMAFYLLTPCRLFDTRERNAVASNQIAEVAATGTCGVPDDAAALAANITIVAAPANGWVTLDSPGSASALNYRAGKTRANNTSINITNGRISVYNYNFANAPVHFIVDVVGYYK